MSLEKYSTKMFSEMIKVSTNNPFDFEELARDKRILINIGQKAKWHNKLLCAIFGHKDFIPIDHYNDVNDENSKVIWYECSRCHIK